MRKQDAQGRPLAEWWKRAVAFIIDYFIIAIPGAILMSILGFGLGAASQTAGGAAVYNGGTAVGSLFIGLLGVAYFVYFNGGEKGQTVGKMAMKIRVTDEATGGSCGYAKAFIRYLVAWVMWAACVLPGIVDALFPLWDDKRQSIHDKAGSTLVVEVE